MRCQGLVVVLLADTNLIDFRGGPTAALAGRFVPSRFMGVGTLPEAPALRERGRPVVAGRIEQLRGRIQRIHARAWLLDQLRETSQFSIRCRKQRRQAHQSFQNDQDTHKDLPVPLA
jgi:hypothetical protein